MRLSFLLLYTPLIFPFFFFLLRRPPPISTLFPYTTLFRSGVCCNTYASSEPSGDHAKQETWRSSFSSEVISPDGSRSEEHTSELQSRFDLVCRLLLEKKKKNKNNINLLNIVPNLII